MKIIKQANFDGLIGRTIQRDGEYYEVLGYTIEHEEGDFIMLYCLRGDRMTEISLNMNVVRVAK